MAVRSCGAAGGIPLLDVWGPNPEYGECLGRVPGGQFDWGGRLPKSNGGAQRYAQVGWEPTEECKCRSVPDCDRDNWSRDESRD